MMQLAYEKLCREQKLSIMAQDLKTLAFVLDNRAREKLRGESKSGNESDIILMQAREELETIQVQQPPREELGIDHCFMIAAPENKSPNFEH